MRVAVQGGSSHAKPKGSPFSSHSPVGADRMRYL